MPKLPLPQIRPWSQHACNRSTAAGAVVVPSTLATSGSTTTIVLNTATWTTNQYQNFWVTILTGTGAGQTRNITSNTGTTLTVPTWTAPDNTSTFQIVQPQYPGLQGSLVSGSTGGTVLANVTYREVVPTAGAAELTVRLKTTTAVGTLTITPIRLLGTTPDDATITDGLGNVDTTKVQKYSTGGSTATVVVAGTELALTINPSGEAYCMLEFACTTAGTLNYCDVMTLQMAGNVTTSGGGGGTSAVTIANGADTAEGSTTDAPATAPTTTAPLTLLGLFKGALNYLKNIADNTSAATSNAIVPTTTVDPTNTFTQPTGDVAGRSIFTVTQGLVADGNTGTTSAAVLIGGLDSGGLVRTVPVNLASTTPVTTATEGLQTNAVLFGNSSANTLRALLTATGFGTGGSGASTLMVADARASAANAGTYEPVFNNLNTSILASAARTTTQTSADQTNPNHRGIKIVLDVTVAGSGSITLTLNGKDLNSGKYYNILTGSAVSTISTNVYTVFPGATAVGSGNVTVSDMISRLFQIVETANNANTMTYSVSYSLLV